MSYQDDLDWLARNVHEWPAGEHQPWCYVGRDYLSGDMRASGYTILMVKSVLVRRDDWLARRAELQNKPSWGSVGSDINFISQHDDGQWIGHSEKPSEADECFECNCVVSLFGYGEVLGDWRDTLERRPDMHKNHEEIDAPAERVQKREECINVEMLGSGWFVQNRRPVSVSNETVVMGSPVVVGCTGGAKIPFGKLDHGNPIMGAIPPHAELAVARVLTFGAGKYARDAWQSVENAEVRYMDAALRHLNAHRRGELVDDESGESHLAHAACCILFLLDMQESEGAKDE